jgi:hypothetical protein
VTAWADDPAGHLRFVQDKVAGMQSALITGDLSSGEASADEIVAVTTQLLQEIHLDGDRDHELAAEVVATLSVYRNAAFAFRKLADARGGPDQTLVTACAALIDQGHDHLRAYLAFRSEKED